MIEDLEQTNAEYMEMGLTTELVIESENTDVAGQLQQIENLMNQGVDALLVNPGDAVALNQILEEAVEAGSSSSRSTRKLRLRVWSTLATTRKNGPRPAPHGSPSNCRKATLC